jgi:hypothetical protein
VPKALISADRFWLTYDASFRSVDRWTSIPGVLANGKRLTANDGYAITNVTYQQVTG